MAVDPQPYLIELVGKLRASATRAAPDWDSLCYLAQGEGDGTLWDVAVLMAPGGERSGWATPTEANEILLVGQRWREELRRAGEAVWYAMAVGAERASGNVDCFFVEPGPEAAHWELHPARTRAMIHEAWQRLDIEPKYVLVARTATTSRAPGATFDRDRGPGDPRD